MVDLEAILLRTVLLVRWSVFETVMKQVWIVVGGCVWDVAECFCLERRLGRKEGLSFRGRIRISICLKRLLSSEWEE